MLKRIAALFLVLALAFTMAGCTFPLPFIKQPPVNTPEVQTPPTGTPELQPPPERTPEVETPPTNTPVVETPPTNTPAAKTPEVKPTELPMVADVEVSYSAAVPPDGLAVSSPFASGAFEAYFEEEPEPLPFPEFNTEEYTYTKENSFRSVATSPLSTFAADVDTASYSNFRRQVLNGGIVYPDSVRIEEMINYFHYDYPEPAGTEPFSVTTEIAPCPWNADTQLLLIGLQAKKLNTEDMPQSNLVFLIDVSGSMDYDNKLPLVQRSFMTLVENLDEYDKVSIVTYSSGEKIVLDGVPASQKDQIMSAIEGLKAYGSTHGDKAIQMAYELAEKNFIKGGNNRVIMATDGDFNVGVTSTGELTKLVKEKAKSGIYLSVLGFGMGNYKDSRLESMADNGNGNYAYIDSVDEARKVLVEEAGGTLFTVAKDVKIQVDFNPAAIKGYRLIGYENRTMAAEDFADDTKDGGEIGAGHQVTALYEIVPVGSAYEIPAASSKYTTEAAPDNNGETPVELLTVNIRYKEPDGDTSTLLEYPVTEESVREEMSPAMSWAAGVAQVGMVLKDSEYAGTTDIPEVKERLRAISDDDFRDEFVYLIRKINF